MFNRQFFLVLVLALIMPLSTHAQVLLSEIAWMGTDANPSAEWIEIYNFSDTPTDITGYTLTSGDGALSLTLSGTLNPHDVVLLERRSDDAVPGIPALLIYDGELSDSGTTITLKDGTGAISDSASGGAGWMGIGGSASTPVRTAQRTRRGEWVTALPTPGADNAQVSDPVTPTSPLPTTTPVETVGSSSRGGGGGSSKNSHSGLAVTLQASTTLFVGKPGTFALIPSGVSKSTERSLSYYWNFGDTETDTGKEVTHTYAFPGTYLVVGEASSTKKVVSVIEKVEVLPVPLSLQFTNDGDLQVVNMMTTRVTLDGYTLRGNGFTLTFPRNTLIAEGGTITIPHEKIGQVKAITLIHANGDEIMTLSRDESDHSLSAMQQPVVGATVSMKNAVSEVYTEEKFSARTPSVYRSQGAILTALASHHIVYRFLDRIVGQARFS